MKNVLVSFFILCVGIFSSTFGISKDPKNPPHNIYETHKDIIVIPDVHGDLEALFSALIHLKVISQDGEIIVDPNKISDIVFLGDFIDRGPFSRQTLDWIIFLKLEMTQRNIRLHHLLGNHELRLLSQNYSGMLEMDRRNFLESSSSQAIKHIPYIISDPNLPYRKFFLESPVWLKIGRHGFVHAGLHPQMLKWDWNSAQRSAFEEIKILLDLNQTNELHKFEMEDLHPTLADEGFVETRWIAKEADEKKDAELMNKLLEKFDVDRMYIGHTIQENGARAVFNEKIFLLDGGMSLWNLRDHPYISAAVIGRDEVVLHANIQRQKLDYIIQKFIKGYFSESIRSKLIAKSCADPRFFIQQP